MAQRAPELATDIVRGRQFEGVLEEFDRLVELVSAGCRVRSSAQPGECARPQGLELLRVAPSQVGVLRAHGLEVVVGEECGGLAARSDDTRQPLGERRVQPRPPPPREARVCDVARKCVLEDELALAAQRRGRPPADEVALFEQREVGDDAVEELAHGPAPESAADDGRRLHGSLLGRWQPVDARRQHRVHGIRRRQPRASRRNAFGHACEQLLGEERIALGTSDDPFTQLVVETVDTAEHPRRLLVRERLEANRLLAGGTRKLRARRRNEEQRPADAASHPLDQLEQRLLRPVQILDQHDRGAFGDELLHDVDPRLVQLVADRQRMTAAGDVEPEREAEDPALAEALEHLAGRIGLQQPELLPEHVAERRVSGRPPVG
jgi:hypothetical protein